MMADIEKGPEIDGITGESYPPQQSVQQLWIGLAGNYGLALCVLLYEKVTCR